MALVKCRECGNDVSTEAAACPKCGAPPRAAVASAKPPDSGATAKGIIGLIVLGAFMFALVRCADYSGATTSSADHGTPSSMGPRSNDFQSGMPNASEVKPEDPEPLPRFSNLKEAIAGYLPLMSDESDSLSPGAKALGRWSTTNLKFSDLKALPTTGIARVMKSAEKERGKVICTAGLVIEIQSAETEGGEYSIGGLATNDGHIVRFVNVGSSGDLVERHTAALCGVVIGRVDYSNSAGGVAHAVQLVGMFDLPANRRIEKTANR